MLPRKFLLRCLVTVLVTCFGLMSIVLPAQADSVEDRYITQYLKASEPVPLTMNQQGETQMFSPQELYEGKQLFKENCINCHVGGSTLPDPSVSLSLADLKGATPPRDTVDGIVDYLRHPMSYDGNYETYWCREVPSSWMPRAKVNKLAAFILRAAQKAPGWGTQQFDL
ncbi:photosystem II cytochrome PsbV2 [Phormidium sp. CCY1219]|uniref:photosystem II cytochrome PsbV2 n=1 Tax=Phormidium sp. CCY1219 TaxID=2886104 RepID=UPI002D1F750B|nr:photosystem II cytochrome PsbV2 [Phormidium sp. CCY1219]MEB3826458.1 photosystem II cytochrome PsbV2 [Phormidium sp. CCY1219]